MEQWGIATGFLGVAIGVCTSFSALPSESKRKYRIPFIVSLVLIFFGVVVQISAIIS